MNNQKLPLYFRSILWSYNFFMLDPDRDKVIIIINAINYGGLRHWRWISDFYGKSEVANILRCIPKSEIRDRAIRLTSLLFGVSTWNHAPRSFN